MKSRKNGFTLIELLIVIAILGSLGVIISLSLTNTLKDTEKRKCDDFVAEIEDAACVYAGLSNTDVVCDRVNGCEIKLDELVKRGLVTSETDACTGGSVQLNETVSVKWDQTGEKKCTYNGDRVYEK